MSPSQLTAFPSRIVYLQPEKNLAPAELPFHPTAKLNPFPHGEAYIETREALRDCILTGAFSIARWLNRSRFHMNAVEYARGAPAFEPQKSH